nr:hypothetical protein [Polymorphobacter sp.]
MEIRATVSFGGYPLALKARLIVARPEKSGKTNRARSAGNRNPGTTRWGGSS